MRLKEKLFLFDMDGTLTPVRGQIEDEVIDALIRLSSVCKIGIVTGSDYDYIMQQVGPALISGRLPVRNIDLLPCNGTKRYTADADGVYRLVSEVNMLNEIGEKNYQLVLRQCLNYQSTIMASFNDLPYTGTFLQYRGSLLNWCQIGRNASIVEREAWGILDDEYGIRKLYAKMLTNVCDINDINLTIALGGSTSVDIYPLGWDKTFALSYYPDHEIYFAGDKCMEGGNDWHLYEALAPAGRAFMVETTEDTINVIDSFLDDCIS